MSSYCIRAFDTDERADVLLKFRELKNKQDEADFRDEAKLLKRLRSGYVVEMKGRPSTAIDRHDFKRL